MKRISADLIVTCVGQPIPHGIISYDERTGQILEISEKVEHSSDIEYLKGIIVPGYVNAHCHLELSHLKGVIPTGTGLIPFIKGVVTLRDFPEEEIQLKIEEADQYMFDCGIVAVGDISNKVDTATVKAASKVRYYTFVEMFDFLQNDQADATYEQYRKVYEAHTTDQNKNKKSFVPHAPYSVSPTLFEYVNKQNKEGDTISIHNQELVAENDLFLNKTGSFLEFFGDFNIPMENFKPIGKSSIFYTMAHLAPDFKTLKVHNTQTTVAEIKAAHLWNPKTYWVTCPNANLYIENALPCYQNFIETEAKVCIGTDSLSSNWQLSIFQEMKTIKKYQSGLNDLEIIRWGTVNGAEALGYEDLGKLTVGLAPGINFIDVAVEDGSFDLSMARSSTKII